jgi:hypothetical protein
MNNSEIDRILDKIGERITFLSKGDCWLNALRQGRDYIALLEHGEIGAIEAIRARYGTAPQNLEGEPISTNFHDYLDRVINPQIAKGEITDGSRPSDYDDRKIRWSGAGMMGNWFVDDRILYLEIGPTTYPRYALDLRRDKTEALRLILRGLDDYRDPYAYFSKAIAITVAPISEEGYVYIGERSQKVDNPGLLNFVAGLVTFDERLETLDFYTDIRQELQEEAGINLEITPENTRAIGIAGNPFTSENDLVFVTRTRYPNRHFESFAPTEHTHFVPLRNKSEVVQLLDRGLLPNDDRPRAIAYGSRMALEYLADRHF